MTRTDPWQKEDEEASAIIFPHCPHNFSFLLFSVTHPLSLDLSSKIHPFISWCPYLYLFLASVLPLSALWSRYHHQFNYLAWLVYQTWLHSKIYIKKASIFLSFFNFNKAMVFKMLLCHNIFFNLRATPVSTQKHQASCCRMSQIQLVWCKRKFLSLQQFPNTRQLLLKLPYRGLY